MIKAIFFDIDGTLTSIKTGKIPQSTYLALNQLRKKGIKIFVATGRHIIDVDQTPAVHIPFDGYVTLNGQICLDKHRASFYDCPIHPKDVKTFISIFEKKEFQMLIAEKNRKYINYLLEDEESSGFPKTEVGIYHGDPVYQFMMRCNQSETKKIVESSVHCKVTHWPPDGSDVIPQNGGKIIGIQKMMEHYGILPNETMAFGDGDNDKEMLSFVHIGVAMGNAEPTIQHYADYVTATVEDHGILKALKHFDIL